MKKVINIIIVFCLLCLSGCKQICSKNERSKSYRDEDSHIRKKDLEEQKLSKNGANIQYQDSCTASSVPEVFNFIGYLVDRKFKHYKVFTDYRELQMSETIRGVSHVILYGAQDSFYYLFDSYEYLPYKANGSLLYYCKNGLKENFSFKNPVHLICSPFGCFEGVKHKPEIFR